MTETNSQRAAETQVHHPLHQENLIPGRAHWSIPPLEVRGTRGRIELWRLWHVRVRSTFLDERYLWYLCTVCLLCVCFSLRDGEGDDRDQCPMWTFPTVRPSSMNKLQRGFNHLDNKVNMSFKVFTLRRQHKSCIYRRHKWGVKIFSVSEAAYIYTGITIAGNDTDRTELNLHQSCFWY